LSPQCSCEHLQSYHHPKPKWYGSQEMETGCAFCKCAAFEPMPAGREKLTWEANTEPGYSERRKRLGLPAMHTH